MRVTICQCSNKKERFHWQKRHQNHRKGTHLSEEAKAKIRISKLGKHCSPSTEFKKGMVSGDKNPRWKGDKAGYTPIHLFVKKRKPKPENCEKCGVTSDKLDLANIIVNSYKDNYSRNLSDYRYFCKSCHVRHDKIWTKRERDCGGRFS